MAKVSLVLEAFAESVPRRPFPIEKDGYYAITKCADDVSIDIDRCPGWTDLRRPECLAIVAIHNTHIVLQSACESCAVVPPSVDLGSPSPSTDDERWTKIALEQSTPKCQYSVVLRPDDRIVFWSKAPRVPRDCTLKVQIDNVQVESSLPDGIGQIERRSQHESIGRSERKVPAATPLAASTTSQVVNETPASRRRQQARGNGRSLNGDVSTTDDRTNAPEEHEGDGDVPMKKDRTNTPEEDQDDGDVSMKNNRPSTPEEHEDDGNVSTMNERTNTPEEHASEERGIRSSVRRSTSAKNDHMDAPEDHEEEDDATVSESENDDDLNEEPSPIHSSKPSNPNQETEIYSGNRARALSPRVEIPATRGYKRTAQEDIPRASKRQSIAPETPPSSARSQRSAVYVAFSNSSVNSRPSTLKFLARQGVKIQDSVTNCCDYLCVNASGQLIKSFKLLMSVILGKPIISDEWVLKSLNAKKLVDPDDFITTNAPSEWRWGKTKEDVAKALRRDRSKLFEGLDIFITPKLKKDYGAAYKDIEKLLKETGASTVASKQARSQDPSSTTVVIGSENDDADVAKLSDSGDEWSCFSKELISMTILRGQLDLDSNEFKLRSAKSGKKAGRPGRPKKSK
ncbi:uncharacterized protein J3D65DRAFT_639220 [Phyllosticta citribraziliensis]|uniref:BRCT domain-containing protein n=1 Tax=Phyllosticta citribraziliensis TaxID=989973 RepID=A0ABR1L7Q3_9PEZI